MEPVTQPLRKLNIGYTIIAGVKIVEKKFITTWISGRGEEAIFQKEFLGWFVQFDGSSESINFGSEKPHLFPGDQVRITITKEPVDARSE